MDLGQKVSPLSIMVLLWVKVDLVDLLLPVQHKLADRPYH
jgi:hypothetical protein